MKILLLSVGTRGDMEPFLAIGEILKNNGHQIICAFPEQFENLPIQSGFEFKSLGKKFIKLLESDYGKAAMGSAKGFKKFISVLKLAFHQKEANIEVAIKQYQIIEKEHPDRIIYNGKAVYPLLWEIENKNTTIMLSPIPYMHYVEGNSHIGFNSNFGKTLNKLSFKLAHFGLLKTTNIAKKWMGIQKKYSSESLKKIFKEGKTIYTISPSLFERPDYWHSNLQVVGYRERNNAKHFSPPNELEKFIDKHDKLLFVSFGSMTNPEPIRITANILRIIQKNKIPAIINTAGGGLIKPDNFHSDFIYFVNEIPYDYIFPKVYAVIHHGGSGTTHMGLKHACPTLIIPHIIDQFVWNKLIHKRKLGPKGMNIGKVKFSSLETKILDLLNNSEYKSNAANVSEKMKQELNNDTLLEFIFQ